ncbi:hypothetical protein J7K97_02235 [Candidatus Aerophobetes bacterium]|nr:hypothetical protein [Candidatus Aerophobetes bacterium]
MISRKFFPFIFVLMIAGFPGFSFTFCMAGTKGYVKTTGYYFTQGLQDKERMDMEINLETSFSLYDSGKGFFSYKLYADDLLGKSSRNSLSLDEAYLDIYTQNSDIRIGKQYIFWGKTTGVDTPTNNINPWDLSRIKPDPEQQRIAVGAIKVDYFRGYDLAFEGVWIPDITFSKLPSFTLPTGVAIGEEKYPQSELKNTSYGLKIDKFGSKVDFSLSYLYTWDSFPDYNIDLSAFPFITLVPVHHRVSIYGTSFATGIGETDIKGEAAYFQTEDTSGSSIYIKNPYLKYLLEVGYSLTDNLDIIVQFSGKKIFNFKSPDQYAGIPPELAEQFSFLYGEQREWQNSLTTHLTYKTWYDRLKLEFLGTYNLTLEDYMLSPQLSYEVGKGFDFGAGAMIFEGKPGTQFGTMDNEDFIWCDISYSFS